MDEIVTNAAAFVAGAVGCIGPSVPPLALTLLVYLFCVSRAEGPSGGSLSPLFHGLSFLGGFLGVFFILGSSGSDLGNFLFHHQRAAAAVGGILLVPAGLMLLRAGPPPAVFLRPRLRRALSLAVGSVMGLAWAPCVGPVLGSILLLAGSEDTLLEGFKLLGFYSLGAAAPLAAFVTVSNVALRFVRPAQGRGRALGVFLVLAGALTAAGAVMNFFEWWAMLFDFWVEVLVPWGL